MFSRSDHTRVLAQNENEPGLGKQSSELANPIHGSLRHRRQKETAPTHQKYLLSNTRLFGLVQVHQTPSE